MYKDRVGDESWSSTEPPWESREDLLLTPPTDQAQLEADWQALQHPVPEDGCCPKVSDEKLREFVLGVLEGSLYTSDQVRDRNLLSMVFLPLALGALNGWREDQLKEIGVLYAPMSAALPRSINGYPIFGEFCLLNKDDWARASKAIHREWSRRQKIEI